MPRQLSSKRSGAIAHPRRVAARGTLQLLGAEACVMGCGYVTVIVLARGLGPEDYGIYGTIMSVLVAAELIGRLGIPQALGKLIAEHDVDAAQIEQTGLATGLMVSATILGLFWISAPAMARLFHIPNGVMLFRLAAIDIPFYGLYFVGDEILGGRRQFGLAALGTLIYGLGKAAGMILLWWGGISVSGALVINILASAGALLFMTFFLSFKTIYLHFDCLMTILRLALPIGLLTLGVQALFSMDLWCLKALGGGVEEETIGFYIAAGNVAKMPTVAAFVMTAILIPCISRALSLQDQALARRYVQGGMRFLCVVLIPVCVLLALTAEPLMTFLYSHRYASGAIFLRILVFGFGLAFTCLIACCAVFIASGFSYLAPTIALALIPVALICNSLFIPLLGAMGAALASAITMTLGAATAGWLLLKKVGSCIMPAVLVKVGVATGCMTVIGYQLEPTGLLLVVTYPVLLGVYALCLALLGELTWDDLQLLALWDREKV